ncbi:unnamed protein product [Oppiella nova]|uniref:Uncharacterized protein n=1 Tax=Oppiella nova TaxID=334625 RepID=A0A7R9ML40_9ACAR|nr:unnamed protein product [Oppiella nova]CAG2179292.1 unnamed protein product [Oppiella nova]
MWTTEPMHSFRPLLDRSSRTVRSLRSPTGSTLSSTPTSFWC